MCFSTLTPESSLFQNEFAHLTLVTLCFHYYSMWLSFILVFFSPQILLKNIKHTRCSSRSSKKSSKVTSNLCRSLLHNRYTRVFHFLFHTCFDLCFIIIPPASSNKAGIIYLLSTPCVTDISSALKEMQALPQGPRSLERHSLESLTTQHEPNMSTSNSSPSTAKCCFSDKWKQKDLHKNVFGVEKRRQIWTAKGSILKGTEWYINKIQKIRQNIYESNCTQLCVQFMWSWSPRAAALLTFSSTSLSPQDPFAHMYCVLPPKSNLIPLPHQNPKKILQ